MYKIYINENLILLISSDELESNKNHWNHDLIARYPGHPDSLVEFVELAEKSSHSESIVIHSNNYEILKADFKSLFKIVKAAGSLVINPLGQALLIYRRGYWDLPKGKINKAEKKKIAASRELMEETGLNKATILRKLGKTYHTYRSFNDKRILKRTHWYLMESEQVELTPQLDEGIARAEWVDLKKFLNSDPKIYKNIRELLTEYLNSNSMTRADE